MNAWVRRALVTYVVGACSLALLSMAIPTSAIFLGRTSAAVVRTVFDVGMFAPLAVGAVFGFLAARNLEADNPVRKAWLLLAVWLLAFATGEGFLMGHVFLLGREPLPPSLGDACFVLGYPCLVVGTFLFARVYAASGLPIGKPREFFAIGGGVAAMLSIAAYIWLLPLSHVQRPLFEKTTLIAYPVLDLFVLVPTAVLCRITWNFRGGSVWRVWGAICAGFTILAVADILCAYEQLAGMTHLAPLEYITYMTGYLLTALATMGQYELSRR